MNTKEAVIGYLKGHDVFLCSQTGSGKSLTFEIAPFVFSFVHHKDQLPKLTSSVMLFLNLFHDVIKIYMQKFQTVKYAAKSTHIIVLTSFIQIHIQTNFIC